MVSIQFKTKKPLFSTIEERTRFARLVTRCFPDNLDFKPEPLHGETSGHYWTVDRGNDWKIAFRAPDEIEFIHRHSEIDGLEKLANWAFYQDGIENFEEIRRIC